MSFMSVKHEKQPAKKLEDTVRSIQQGDLGLREQFILDYKPFISKCTSKYVNHFINESSDEFSIALIAFNESINAFKIVRGMNFLSFSEIVIKNRLIDNARKNKNYNNVYSMVSLEGRDEEDQPEPYDFPSEDPSFARIEIADEIRSFSQELNSYGICFGELVKHSPKHQDTRMRMISLARVIYGNRTLLDKMKKTKSIPIREVLELTSVCRGTIEQNRKYIIALVLILDSRLEVLRGYVDDTTKGGGHYAD